MVRQNSLLWLCIQRPRKIRGKKAACRSNTEEGVSKWDREAAIFFKRKSLLATNRTSAGFKIQMTRSRTSQMKIKPWETTRFSITKMPSPSYAWMPSLKSIQRLIGGSIMIIASLKDLGEKKRTSRRKKGECRSLSKSLTRSKNSSNVLRLKAATLALWSKFWRNWKLLKSSHLPSSLFHNCGMSSREKNSSTKSRCNYPTIG